MDKQTLSNYGWIVIAVLVLSVMIALSTPFGNYVKDATLSTLNGLFDIEEEAMNVIGQSAFGNEHKECNVSVLWEESHTGTYYFERQSDDNGSSDYYVWKSNNIGKKSTSAISTFTINVPERMEYSFNWSVSSQPSYDKLSVVLNGLTIISNQSGINNGTKTIQLNEGTNTIKVTYYKNSSTDENDDCATITLNSIITSGHKSIETSKQSLHTYGVGSITKEQTCTEYGEMTYTCIYCGYKKTEKISKHTDENKDTICDICNEQIYGLFDSNNVLLMDWDRLCIDYGLNIEADYEYYYSSYDNYYKKGGSMNYVLNSTSDFSTATKLIVSNSVTSIGKYAFYYCPQLTSVILPNSITNIGDSAFRACEGLKYVNIPNGVTKMDGLFMDCKSLTSIEIPNSVTSIGYATFRGCKSLISIEIPESVTNIAGDTFSGCSSLTSVNIPYGITIINSYLFGGCESLVSVEIPNSVTEIWSYAFQNCKNLTSIEIPDSVKLIDGYAFRYCKNLTSVNLGNGITKIGGDAFYECSKLTSIEIPESVTRIGSCAFAYSGLRSVTFKDTTTWYEKNYNNTTATQIDVTNASSNATFLKSTNSYKYWEKTE